MNRAAVLELLAAWAARWALFRRIRAAGRPPHSDFWHQAIAEADARVVAARRALVAPQ